MVQDKQVDTLFSVTIQFYSLDVTLIAAFAVVSYKIPATVFRMYEGEGDFLQVSQSNICNFVGQHRNNVGPGSRLSTGLRTLLETRCIPE